MAELLLNSDGTKYKKHKFSLHDIFYIVGLYKSTKLVVGDQTWTLNLSAQTSSSSSHVVFFGQVTRPDMPEDMLVAVKFRAVRPESPDGYSTIEHITDERLYGMCKKTQRLARHLDKFNATYQSISNLKKVVVNPCWVIHTKHGLLWVEEYLEDFTKFWNRNEAINRIDRMLTTHSVTLDELQRFIYVASEGRYTVVDLQGCHTLSKDQQYYEYRLCDVEFTDTFHHGGFSSHDLIRSWESLLDVSRPLLLPNILSGAIPEDSVRPIVANDNRILWRTFDVSAHSDDESDASAQPPNISWTKLAIRHKVNRGVNEYEGRYERRLGPRAKAEDEIQYLTTLSRILSQKAACLQTDLDTATDSQGVPFVPTHLTNTTTQSRLKDAERSRIHRLEYEMNQHNVVKTPKKVTKNSNSKAKKNAQSKVTKNAKSAKAKGTDENQPETTTKKRPKRKQPSGDRDATMNPPPRITRSAAAKLKAKATKKK